MRVILNFPCYIRPNPAFITSQTVEVVVPEHAIGSIVGDSGRNLQQICKVSLRLVVCFAFQISIYASCMNTGLQIIFLFRNSAGVSQISGARVKVNGLTPGALERIVEISGTPDQTHAAQSLLQAFILSGQ